MASTIKVDTIENVAGSGNVSLGSGHNLVVPGNITGSGTLGITGTIAGSDTLSLNGVAAQTTYAIQTQTKSVYLNSTDSTYSNLTLKKGSATTTDYLQLRDGSNNLDFKIDSEGRFTSENQPNCMIYKSGNQSISSGTPTNVTGWALSNGISSMFDSTNHRITAPVAGTYIVGGIVQFNTAGGAHIAILKNNAAVGNDSYLDAGTNDGVGGVAYSMLLTMSTNDFISMTVYQTVNANVNANRTKLWMAKVA